MENPSFEEDTTDENHKVDEKNEKIKCEEKMKANIISDESNPDKSLPDEKIVQNSVNVEAHQTSSDEPKYKKNGSDEANQTNQSSKEPKYENVESDKNILVYRESEETKSDSNMSDEPDGGKKKDSTVEEFSKKKSISFENTFDSSHEENETQGLEGKIALRKSVKWDDEPKIDNKKRKDLTMSMASIYSTASSISLDPNDAGFRTLAGFVVLKILFWDIGSSLGDTVTDFLQGLYLMYDWFKVGWVPRDDTWYYGIIVLVINWVPGIVAIIHIISHYRREYFSLPNTGSSDQKLIELIERRKRNFVIVVFCCFFFYPLVPTIGYLIVLWNINNNSNSNRIHFSRLELFARTSHSISGCVEAPLQLVVTCFLIIIGLLDIPWKESIHTGDVQDRFENTILPGTTIPFWTMTFSILNIIGSAIQVNIFNVYIGQIRNMHGFKKYINLTCGHFPFFFHSIIFRVLALSFFLVYLDFKAILPIFLILLSNLIIGYLTSSEHKLSKDVRRALRIVKKSHKEIEDHPTLQAKGGGGSKSNTSVWLNSFLGICVPTCFVQDVEPVLLLDMEEKIQQQIFESQKNYQRKVIKYQIQTSVTIILVTLLTVFCLVNFTDYGYNPNRFNNLDFNIYCSVIFAMSITALLFVREIDVYEAFKMNEAPALIEDYLVSVTIPKDEIDSEPKAFVQIPVPENATGVTIKTSQRTQKKYGTSKKFFVTVFITVLTMAPLMTGYLLSYNLSNKPAYILAKNGNSSELTITAVKSKLLNDPYTGKKFSGKVKFCYDSNDFECQTELKDVVLVVDLNDTECVKAMEKSEVECLSYAGLVLLENWDHRSSRPYPLKIQSDFKKFPIVSVNSKDTIRLIKKETFKENSRDTIEISLQEYGDILEDPSSELYETQCDDGCLHMFEAKEKYLGCTGVPKMNIDITLECYDKGKTCSELMTFKKNMRNKNPFRKCFQQEGIDPGEIEYPRPSCLIENNLWLDSDKCLEPLLERDFDWKNEQTTSTSCLDESDNTLITYSQPPSVCDCRSQWGPWSAWDDQCKYSPTSIPHKKRYRLCRQSMECVLVKWERFNQDDTTKECTSELPWKAAGYKNCEFN
eukprot:GFUD01002300.1.p1 GENE.GFUD01002300.1~~GFUD01002300.1.p1  ORF type:complete len:1094 (-),score=216.09 GFUD01002300.1:133-3414(-)